MLDDFYHLALAALRHHLTEAGVPFSEEDGDLTVADHRLGLSITFEGFAEQGGQVIAPLDVQICLDGDTGDRFRVGALGVGPDRQHAMQSAIHEWHLLAAAPVLAALGAELSTRRPKSTPRRLAGWDLYPGRVGIRGASLRGLQLEGDFYRELFQALQKTVNEWPVPVSSVLRSIFIMATSHEGQRDVQAAVDGFVDEGLGGRLAALPWPGGSEAYLYKQLYVLRGGEDV